MNVQSRTEPDPTGPETQHRDDPAVPMGNETLIGSLKSAADAGYRTQLIARATGDVDCENCKSSIPPTDLRVRVVQRLEGASDAADLMVSVWATCPECDARGVLLLGYGPNAGDADLLVLPDLDLDDAQHGIG